MNNLREMTAVRTRNLIVLVGLIITSIVLVVLCCVEVVIGNMTELSSTLVSAICIIALLTDFWLFSKYAELENKFGVISFTMYIILHFIVSITCRGLLVCFLVLPMLVLASSYSCTKVVNHVAIVTSIDILLSCVIKFILEPTINFNDVLFVFVTYIFITVFVYLARTPILRDLERLEGMEEAIQIDTLTKCWNRNFLDNLIEHGFFKDSNVKLILGDINDFKHINDVYGHMQGDIALICIGAALKEVCDKYNDTWEIRIGGDEFIIVTKVPKVEDLMVELHHKCLKVTKQKELQMNIQVAFGVSYNKNGSLSYRQLYELADADMYKRKEIMKGGNKYDVH